MKTLKSRLILSHILPLVIILPVLGLILAYILETQVILTGISNELSQDSLLTAAEAGQQAEIWANPNEAQSFVRRYSTYHRAQIALVDPQGNIIASSQINPDDDSGQSIQLPNLANLVNAETSAQIIYQVETVEVLAPVVGANQQILGAVQLTRQLDEVNDQFVKLRQIIIGAFLAALAASVVIGLYLALRLGYMLQQATDAIYGIANGRAWHTLPVKGPEEMRSLLQAFNTLIERLQMLEDARRRLLANLVHEIGRPIGAIQSAVHALLSGGLEDSHFSRELLDGMDDQTRRLMPLLDNLAELHGQVLGTFELEPQPTNLNEWLPRVFVTWRAAARAGGLAWQIDIAPNLPTLEIDTTRIAQAIGNLLSNAIKYTPKGGTVTFSAATHNEGILMSVSDTGPGIAPDEQVHIFEPFYRSQRDRRFPQGMGLGLSIAHDIVAAHQGRLEVESAPGEGSRFTIWLPLKTSASGSPN